MRGIATDQMPAETMLSAMVLGSNRLLYSGGSLLNPAGARGPAG